MKGKPFVAIAALVMLCGVLGAQAQSGGQTENTGSSLRPDLFKGNTIPYVAIDDSTRTQLLILGTLHLRVLGDKLKPAALDSLLGVLGRYKPSIIGVESMSPDMMARMELTGESPELLKYYAHDNLLYGKLAQKALGISRDKAESEANSLVAKQVSAEKEQPLSMAARQNLVLQFVAAYDLESAALQWSYLPVESRNNSSVVPKQVADFLNSLLVKADEKYQVAVPLAHRLGLQRIMHIDDHLDDQDQYQPLTSQMVNQFGPAKLKEVGDLPLYKDSQQLLDTDAAKGDLLPCYLYVNSQDYSTPDINTQWAFFLKANLPSKLDRTRLLLWEARNLEIAAHIREVMALSPGARMLVVIGAAHKPFLDTYLKNMMDIRIRSLAEFAGQ